MSFEHDDHFSEVSEEHEEKYMNELEGEVRVVKDVNGERKEVDISEIMPSKVRIQLFFMNKH